MTTLESLFGLLQEMGLKEEANSVEQLSHEMEDRIIRAEEESKELKESLSRQLKGAALAEIEKQTLAANNQHTTSLPWLSSRSYSGFSSSGSYKKKSMSSSNDDSDKINVKSNNNPLKQVVVVNENVGDNDDLLQSHEQSNELRVKSYDLNMVLNDNILFSDSLDEENLFLQRTGGVMGLGSSSNDMMGGTPPASPMMGGGGGSHNKGLFPDFNTPKGLKSWSYDNNDVDYIERGGVKRGTTPTVPRNNSGRRQNFMSSNIASSGNRNDSRGTVPSRTRNAQTRQANTDDTQAQDELPSGNCIIA